LGESQNSSFISDVTLKKHEIHGEKTAGVERVGAVRGKQETRAGGVAQRIRRHWELGS
jgi:hypothetical protein